MAASVEVPPKGGWKPTRKWIGGLVVGLLTIVLHAVTQEGWDSTNTAEVVTLAISLAGAYFVTNDPTPGGVPAKKEG